MASQQEDDQQQEQGITSRVGLIEIDWPKTIGYYSGIGLALALEVIDLPVAVFIAAIPIFKMLSHPKLPMPLRVAGQVLEGVSQPVGGADEATVHLASGDRERSPKRRQQGSSIWVEARALADRQRQRRQHSGQNRQQQAAAG